MSDHLLVAGLPRSGSTWLCEVLGLRGQHEVILEPDNEKTSWPASRLKRHLPRFPALCRGAQDPAFAQLWHYAFNGRGARHLCRGTLGNLLNWRGILAERAISAKEHAAGRASSHLSAIDRFFFRRPNAIARRLVKSVHIPFCAEWVADQIGPAKVVVLIRHPLSVIASMMRLNMPDAFRRGSLWPHLSQCERELVDQVDRGVLPFDIRLVALQAMTMHEHLQAAAARHPEWIAVRFENLCAAPHDTYRSLFDRLGYDWDPAIESKIAAMNRPGAGYQTRRVALHQIESWKRELGAADIEAIESIIPNITSIEPIAALHSE